MLEALARGLCVAVAAALMVSLLARLALGRLRSCTQQPAGPLCVGDSLRGAAALLASAVGAALGLVAAVGPTGITFGQRWEWLTLLPAVLALPLLITALAFASRVQFSMLTVGIVAAGAARLGTPAIVEGGTFYAALVGGAAAWLWRGDQLRSPDRPAVRTPSVTLPTTAAVLLMSASVVFWSSGFGKLSVYCAALSVAAPAAALAIGSAGSAAAVGRAARVTAIVAAAVGMHYVGADFPRSSLVLLLSAPFAARAIGTAAAAVQPATGEAGLSATETRIRGVVEIACVTAAASAAAGIAIRHWRSLGGEL